MNTKHDISSMIYSLSFQRDETADLRIMNQIGRVPTQSHRQRRAKNALNAMLNEDPSYANTIYALLTYSTQKWAAGKRRELDIDYDKSLELGRYLVSAEKMLRDIELKTGIKPMSGNSESFVTETSDAILDCVEDAVAWLEDTPDKGKMLSDTIKALHFTDTGIDVNPYMFDRYYCEAIRSIHSRYGSRISELITELTSYRWLYDGETNSEKYHCTDELIKIYPKLVHRYDVRSGKVELSPASTQRDADHLELLSKFEKAVRCLYDYPVNGEALHEIIRMKMEHRSDSEIRELRSYPSSTLFQMKTVATNLVSYILWGYSTSEILSGTIFVPFSKSDLAKNIIS